MNEVGSFVTSDLLSKYKADQVNGLIDTDTSTDAWPTAGRACAPTAKTAPAAKKYSPRLRDSGRGEARLPALNRDWERRMRVTEEVTLSRGARKA